jgi:hypothetical protein
MFGCLAGEPESRLAVNKKRVQRLYREERLTVRRRGGRIRASLAANLCRFGEAANDSSIEWVDRGSAY